MAIQRKPSTRSKTVRARHAVPQRASPQRAKTQARNARSSGSDSDRTTGDGSARIAAIVATLQRAYPGATCALLHANPLQLLVATILSAQCTDERVNMVTPALFAKYPTARHFAAADLAQVEEAIRSTGFFHNKAKAIIGMAQALMREHGGEVPRDLDALVALPGVGRKTANVVLGTAFGIASGVVVDTHVRRLSWRLGLTDETDPEKIEADLLPLVPRQHWIEFSHLLILHGRNRCSARKPDCENCEIKALCPMRLLEQ